LLSRLPARLWQDVSFAGDPERLAELEAEVTLLREELARLRFERRKTPDPSSIVAFIREIVSETDESPDREDDAWQALADALALRQTLVDTCSEIELGMRTLRSRLESTTFAGLGEAGPEGRAEPDANGSQPDGNGVDARTVVAALLDELSELHTNGGPGEHGHGGRLNGNGAGTVAAAIRAAATVGTDNRTAEEGETCGV
jgi:MoxR-like ATPase